METQSNTSNGGTHILIVEDSPTQAERLKFILERNGYGFTTARNGREALAAIGERIPSLVISDIVMPEMDGYQLCGHLKKDEKLKNIPIILLTSLTDPIDVVKGLECEADNFIFKPYDEKYLLNRITYMLAHRHLRDNDSTKMGVEIFFAGSKFFITSDRLQILNLLLSTYEAAVQRNRELADARDELRQLNMTLEARVLERTDSLQVEMLKCRQAEEEIRLLNAGLEQRVLERTAQLEATNQEIRLLNAGLEQRVQERTAQLEASNQELSRSNAELGQFAHVASHDLQEPLRTVSSCVQILQKRYAGAIDARSDELINHVVQGCQRMWDRIGAMLSLARVNATPEGLDTIDTAALVEQVRDDIAHAIRESGAILSHGGLPRVKASPQLLAQLFQNLIGNALKFCGDSPAVVHVSAVCKAGEWIFSVADQGIGIDPEHFERIFQLFQRLHPEDRFPGTGLGLAICKTIVTRHGGRIWVESQPGRGTTFFFTLPEIP